MRNGPGIELRPRANGRESPRLSDDPREARVADGLSGSVFDWNWMRLRRSVGAHRLHAAAPGGLASDSVVLHSVAAGRDGCVHRGHPAEESSLELTLDGFPLFISGIPASVFPNL